MGPRSSPERVSQEVELSFRHFADPCLLLVHRQLQLAHDLAQALQGRSRGLSGRALERVADLAEHRADLGADELDRADDNHCDETCDERVLDCCGAVLVAKEPLDLLHNVAPVRSRVHHASRRMRASLTPRPRRASIHEKNERTFA